MGVASARRRSVLVFGVVLALVLPFGVTAGAGHGHGSLDPSFGSRGIVKTAIGSDAFANALAIQRDGKLVAAGEGTKDTNSVFALARYRSNGRLDPGFGSGGIVTSAIGDDAQANALAIQPDGSLVAAGDSSATFGSKHVFTLVRYDTNGALDTSFGSGGVVTTAIGSDGGGAQALVIQPDGKLVAAGRSLNSSGRVVFTLARYSRDGSLDPSFGSGGIVTTSFGSASSFAYALAVEPDGKLVAGGETKSRGRVVMALARYKADGSLDGGFGVGGKVLTPIGSAASASALGIQKDGKLLAAGSSGDFALVRYRPSGKLDPGFGKDGIVETAFGGSAEAAALVVQPDGKLVLAGDRFNDANLTFVFALARYKPNGRLDPTFGRGGKVTIPIGSAASALIRQPDGNLVAAGFPGTPFGNNVFTLARYRK